MHPQGNPISTSPPSEEVLRAFLKKLDGYRQHMAFAFKKANPELLTEVTQRTLNRIMVIRFFQDKRIEPPQVENFEKQELWEDFITSSGRLDRKFEGIVFQHHPTLDARGFHPNRHAFASIYKGITDPASRYNFNALPISCFGTMHEHFLGKVISDKTLVEDEREARKAGGVFYTHEHMVRYMVANTIGKRIEGRTPEEITEMRFADIACGGGAFLVGIFETLLRYHSLFYDNHPTKAKKAGCISGDNGLRLSLKLKQNILTNNIYGVDIDPKAVEVAQLSLYLKLLEDETAASLNTFQTKFSFTLLPPLKGNVVCGNSLISPDILNTRPFNEAEKKRLNVMDYSKRFQKIMTCGGFDGIIGNPPYNAELGQRERDYLKTKFNVSIADTAALFILQQMALLKGDGIGSFIVPKPLLYASNWMEIRTIMMPVVQEVCDCSNLWREVKLEQIVYRLQKGSVQDSYRACIVMQCDRLIREIDFQVYKLYSLSESDVNTVEARAVKASALNRG